MKSPSDPTSSEIEDHVFKGYAIFGSWCTACVKDREAPRITPPGTSGCFTDPSVVVGLLLPRCQESTSSGWVKNNMVKVQFWCYGMEGSGSFLIM